MTGNRRKHIACGARNPARSPYPPPFRLARRPCKARREAEAHTQGLDPPRHQPSRREARRRDRRGRPRTGSGVLHPGGPEERHERDGAEAVVGRDLEDVGSRYGQSDRSKLGKLFGWICPQRKLAVRSGQRGWRDGDAEDEKCPRLESLVRFHCVFSTVKFQFDEFDRAPMCAMRFTRATSSLLAVSFQENGSLQRREENHTDKPTICVHTGVTSSTGYVRQDSP